MKLRKYRSVRVATILVIISALSQILLQYLSGYLAVDNFKDLKKRILMIGIVILFTILFLYLRLRMKEKATFYFTQDLSQKFDKLLAEMNYDEYNSKDQGERLSVYVNDIPKIRELVLDKYFSMMDFLFKGIWIFLALLRIHYSIVIIAIISAIIMVFIPSFLQKQLAKEIKDLQDSKEEYTSKIRELLHGFNTFIENSAIEKFLEKTRVSSFYLSSAQLKSGKFTSFMSTILTGLNFITTILGLSIVSYLVILGELPMGSLISVLSLLPNFGASVVQFISERQFYKSGLDLYESKFGESIKEKYSEDKFYKNIIATDNILEVESDINNIKKDINTIELKNVRVVYDDEIIQYPKYLIFEKNKKYGVIGESGSGKSTLLKIILGQIRNFEGNIYLNGKEYKDSLFDSISYVSQNTFLFNDTIRNNIDINGLYDDSTLMDILENMNLGDFNLDYEIKDNGKNLSGGQRQRLSIARSIINNKKFLIIDEGTSSLDKDNADKIEEYLFNKFDTIIMVTHRLSENIENKLDEIINLS